MVAAGGKGKGGGYPEAEGCEPLGSEWLREETLQSVAGLKDLSLASYRHSVHGTTAVLAHAGGPLCSVGMSFATEAKDDKGLVHCLEHLCFMGSRSYPKGHLDLLATRCGCDGTNAYTDADHTCFELEAAGETGLLNVLPVFVNHVLCPKLTEDAFLTEIYHVNGKGERQGVVYSEMLGRVTDEEDMLDLEIRKATFGDSSPYSYEFGGLPPLIAKLSRAEIERYHKQVYTTDNLHMIISGAFDDAKVLAMVSKALDDAVGQGAQQLCQQRPFLSPLPPLPSECPRRRTVTFPSEDISVGTVAYCNRLKGVDFHDSVTIVALDVLGRYLTALASAPLEQAFVQCDPPVASGVTCEFPLTADPHFVIELTGVPFRASPAERRAAKRMCGDGAREGDESGDDDNADSSAEDGDQSAANEEEEEEAAESDDAEDEGPDWFEGDALLQRLIKELQTVQSALASGDESVLAELRRAAKKEEVSSRVSFEDGPNEFVRDALLPHLMLRRYPSKRSSAESSAHRCVLQTLCDRHAALASMLEKPAEWWAALLDEQLLQPLIATCSGKADGAAEVRACPSALLSLSNERREEKDAKKNAKSLGKKKLKALQERVDAAEEANLVDLDDEQRQRFPPPVTSESVPDFNWEMNLQTPGDGGIEVLEVDAPSSFVELHLRWLLDADVLSGREGSEMRAYLSLYAALMCESDVAGENYRSVVARLDHELVSYSAKVDYGSEWLQPGTHPCQLVLKLCAEPADAATLVAWAERLSYELEFPEEKVLATCRRIVTGIKASMREGDAVLENVVTTAVYSPLSPQVVCGALYQRSFLDRCCADIGATCEALRRLRAVLVAPSTPTTAVVSGGDCERRGDVSERLQRAWHARQQLLRPSLLEKVRWGAGFQPRQSPLLPLRRVVVGCGGMDTANVHLRATLPAPPLALDARKHGALRLLCEALSMMEGPLSMAVRGKGMAYGASLKFVASENAVTLDLWECTNVRKSLEAAIEVLRSAPAGDALETFQLDNARGALVFQLKGARASPTSVVGAAAGAAMRGWRSAAEVAEWEQRLGAVTRDDVLAAHAEYVAPLADPGKVVACVVCDPGDCRKTAKGLAAALGVDASSVHVKESVTDCYDIVAGRIKGALEELDK
eukprot:TRINITY_DN3236_c0_g2_i1.p1 TRINITY_DN3236_c0_g2~~TRINITY_DN3236_c0_g2_i1.p1  ORF type:complete len:1137 (-),score=290.56 TRINITY_DN3236_c0_g2_i1:23-3433(-)